MHEGLRAMLLHARTIDADDGRLTRMIRAAMGLAKRAQRMRTHDTPAWNALLRILAGTVPRGSKPAASDIEERKRAREMATSIANVQEVAAARLEVWQRRTAAEKQRRVDEDDEWATNGEGAAATAQRRRER